MVGFYQIYKYVQSKKEVIFGTHLINLGAFLTKIVKFDPLVMLIEILEGQEYGSDLFGWIWLFRRQKQGSTQTFIPAVYDY